MRTFITAILLGAALIAPAAAQAKPDSATRTAKADCKEERGKSRDSRADFRAKYRSFAHCVRVKTAAAEKRAARRNAAKQCKAERADPDFADTHDGKSFEDFYGTNGNKRNAFGKCVSIKAREKRDDEAGDDGAGDDESGDAKEESAGGDHAESPAKQCAEERRELGDEEFGDRYGTNGNKRNAFGKCVSKKARDGGESAT